MLLVEGDEIPVLQVRVVFDLVDCRRDGGGLEDGLEVWLEKVGDSDRLGFAGGFDAFHAGPGCLERGFLVAEEGGVD